MRTDQCELCQCCNSLRRALSQSLRMRSACRLPALRTTAGSAALACARRAVLSASPVRRFLNRDSGGHEGNAPPPAPPAPPPPPPPLSSSTLSADGVAEGVWSEFQHYLRHVEEADPELLALAQGLAPHPPVLSVTRRDAAAAAAGEPAPSPLVSAADTAELAVDLAHEAEAVLEEVDDLHDAHTVATDGDAVGDFGDDAEHDAAMLQRLRGQRVRWLQDDVDGALPALLVPDKCGRVPIEGGAAAAVAPTCSTAAGVGAEAEWESLAPVRMLHPKSYLAAQDRLYMAPRTPPEAQLRPPGGTQPAATAAATAQHPCRCILVVFAANDLRVHDNHLLALASVRARAAAAETGSPVPVIGVCVLDYRTFAQPSVVGGFFRQSPQRAQFLLDTVAALRHQLEHTLRVPLLLRCGRPEEHVPRLAVELGALDVFMTTQYAPHERRVQALMTRRLRARTWVSRAEVLGGGGGGDAGNATGDADDAIIAVVEHAAGDAHPYHHGSTGVTAAPPTVHSVWQTTLVHLDDLPTPLAAMKEGERWYHDDVTVSAIRPTEPYDRATALLATLPMTWQVAALLPTEEERAARAGPTVLRGAVPQLVDLGYSTAAVSGVDFAFQEVIATQSSHPDAGEDAALARLHAWLAEGGTTSLLRYGRERRGNTKMYSQKLARVSPYIAVGALSPRRYYEVLRQHTHAHERDGFVQQQLREGVLRLSRRDYWHWMGLRFGDRLFFSYGPHPEQTDDVPDWRHDRKVVQRWCDGLTGIPLADAAMRELVGTGFVAHEGRQALAWLLTRGYGQDWRLGAEWMERCSLDYDPFVCYGNYAYSCGLTVDDFGEPVRNVHYLAHQHDQTGIYVKKWLPQLSKLPPVYVHRPHVLTARMQAMHGVYLGRNYPYPVKLWSGAQRTLSAAELAAYYPHGIVKGPGYAEAVRYGSGVLQPEELNAAVSPAYVQRRVWATMLPASAFADVAEAEAETVAVSVAPTTTTRPCVATLPMASAV